MYSRRIVLGLISLALGLLPTHFSAFAQPPHFDHSPFDARWGTPSDDPWSNPPASIDPAAQPDWQPHTEIERIEQRMQKDGVPPFVPDVQPSAQPARGQNTVSVQQMQHPLSRKGRKLLQKVQSYFKLGQRAKAKQELAEAVKEPSAAPYAHAILGTEMMQEGHVSAAIPELENAARVLPIAGVHSNLGYALCLTGQPQQGQHELEEALRLDGNSAQARFLMGVLLLNHQSREHESEYDLQMVQDRIRAAHLALAVSQLRRGESEAAEQQLREFLGAKADSLLLPLWNWASAVAKAPHPAVAFGFREPEPAAVTTSAYPAQHETHSNE